jgi:hypothetical protein
MTTQAPYEASDTLPSGELPSEPGSGRGPRSAPPPLPSSASLILPARAAADDALADRMLERLASGDYEGAALAAEALLEFRPRDPDALATAQMAKSELRKLYTERLGSLDLVPHVVMGPEAIFSLRALDFRAGYLLSRVDGCSSLYEIISSGSLPSLEALRIFSELYLRRVITVE